MKGNSIQVHEASLLLPRAEVSNPLKNLLTKLRTDQRISCQIVDFFLSAKTFLLFFSDFLFLIFGYK